MAWRGLGLLIVAAALLAPAPANAQEDTYSGSQMWLHYVPVSDSARLAAYRGAVASIVVQNADANKVFRKTANLSMAPGSSEKLVETTLQAARDELSRGLGTLLDKTLPVTDAAAAGAV